MKKNKVEGCQNSETFTLHAAHRNVNTFHCPDKSLLYNISKLTVTCQMSAPPKNISQIIDFFSHSFHARGGMS